MGGIHSFVFYCIFIKKLFLGWGAGYSIPHYPLTPYVYFCLVQFAEKDNSLNNMRIKKKKCELPSTYWVFFNRKLNLRTQQLFEISFRFEIVLKQTVFNEIPTTWKWLWLIPFLFCCFISVGQFFFLAKTFKVFPSLNQGLMNFGYKRKHFQVDIAYPSRGVTWEKGYKIGRTPSRKFSKSLLKKLSLWDPL